MKKATSEVFKEKGPMENSNPSFQELLQDTSQDAKQTTSEVDKGNEADGGVF